MTKALENDVSQDEYTNFTSTEELLHLLILMHIACQSQKLTVSFILYSLHQPSAGNGFLSQQNISKSKQVFLSSNDSTNDCQVIRMVYKFLCIFSEFFAHCKGIFQDSFTFKFDNFHSSCLFCISNLLSTSNFQMAAI